MRYYNALPTDLRPVHYDLHIRDITHDRYAGSVAISLRVDKPTSELHLHLRDLTIGQVRATHGDGAVACAVREQNTAKEYFVVEFARTLADVGSTVTVTVDYTGTIQTNMAGFYRLAYTDAGETKHMLSTQFEATDARRAFPCLDEPALKATFSVHIEVEQHLTVLGNMPVAREEAHGRTKVVTFERTPVMSTYLLAWAVGEFEYIEGFTSDTYHNGQPLPVRIYTTRGYAKDARFALELAPRIVDYFSTVFELKYPLPKLDLLAVHSFSHNAMENWGLVTYRSTALLYLEERSDPLYKQNVAYVVAHELAHQWFGDLVTMQWWDELWLNEGFATWVGYKAVDYLFPEWDIFAGFVLTSLQTALKLDGLRNSHPIEVPVVDALDIDQLFDAISYLKGASAILMLSSYLGTERFLAGVAQYLNNHQYANATTHDLWLAVGAVTGEPVAAMMQLWITKIGFPVLSVTQHGDTVHLKQLRFLNGGGATPAEDETLWWVPLNVRLDAATAWPDALATREASAPAPLGFFKLSRDTQGAYRVNYAPALLQSRILPHFGRLLTKDRVGLIADVASIAVSGDEHTSTTTFLDLVHSTAVEQDLLGEDYVVWLELCSRLGAFAATFQGDDAALTASVGAFCKSVYARLATLLIEQDVAATDFLKTKLKAHILNTAAGYGIPAVEQFGRELYEQWCTTGKLEPALKSFTFSAVTTRKDLTESEFERVMSEVTHPTSLDSREVALGALGRVSNPEFAQKLLASVLDEQVVPVMDAHFVAISLSQNIAVRDMFWRFFKSNYTRFHELMSTNMVVLDRFVKVTLCNYQSHAMEHDVEQFFAGKDIHGFERSYYQVLDQIKINAAWYERDAAKVKQWLARHNY